MHLLEVFDLHLSEIVHRGQSGFVLTSLLWRGWWTKKWRLEDSLRSSRWW